MRSNLGRVLFVFCALICKIVSVKCIYNLILINFLLESVVCVFANFGLIIDSCRRKCAVNYSFYDAVNNKHVIHKRNTHNVSNGRMYSFQKEEEEENIRNEKQKREQEFSGLHFLCLYQK